MHGQTSLWWTARNEHDTVVRQLLDKDADIEIKDVGCGKTALSWAAR